ncbi:MAG: ADP-forming succinate--CoA ligase subunit beta [Acidobacteria bacterium]|nr:ADP-forming succinate--CoA ligase subunit beta [Acidobacteriota bacterium]
MKIHEYQGKAIFRKYNVPVPDGEITDTPEGAEAIARKMGKPVVVKAQIHAGGRGKAGGVKIAKTPEEAKAHAATILGKKLVTIQTSPEGQMVRTLLVEETLPIARELYLGIVMDRASSGVVFMVSTEGGVEIEKVAHETPEKIVKEHVVPGLGLQAYQARKLAFALGLSAEMIPQATEFMMSLYRCFEATDASLAEINPLVVTSDGRLIALDAKINFDDNALFRHPDIREMRDLHEEEPLEVEASKYALNYIKLDGTVGCMVNGAGLAMGTMDIIQYAGGSPANFLDVGGGASAEQVKHAFEILLSDKNVKAVLINIFGGIMRCDIVATGVIQASKELGVKIPVVVRLEGTNVEQGQKLLRESGLNFTVANGMKDAAEKVVALAK